MISYYFAHVYYLYIAKKMSKIIIIILSVQLILFIEIIINLINVNNYSV